MGLKKPVTGAVIIRWIERNCLVPEGPLIGEPVKLLPFQREIICSIYDSPTRYAIITLPKKNGKTSLAACLLLAKLAGPERLENAQLYSTAQSREQAAVLFDLAAKMVRMAPKLTQYIDVQETKKTLSVPELGSRYKAMSSDADTAHGISPLFVVHDELGQVRGPRWELFQTVERSFGAQRAPLSIIISTQAATDGDLLSMLVDDAKTGADPKIKLFMFSADPSLDAFEEETWKIANPAYGVFLNPEEIRGQAEVARRIPSEEATFRNYVLNQRVDPHATFVSREVWQENGEVPSPLKGSTVSGALDLASVNDLCAAIFVATDGSVHTFAWLPEEGLAEKSRRDKTAYDAWARDGLLLTTPGAAVSYDHVAAFLRGIFDCCNVQAIAFDRVFMKFLRPCLVRAGFTEAELEKFVEHGQGFLGMAPAIRELEARLLGKKLKHGNHPVLQMCAANAAVVIDDAGNKKFTKRKSTGRIDALVALAMAVSVMPADAKPKPRYQFFAVG